MFEKHTVDGMLIRLYLSIFNASNKIESLNTSIF